MAKLSDPSKIKRGADASRLSIFQGAGAEFFSSTAVCVPVWRKPVEQTPIWGVIEVGPGMGVLYLGTFPASEKR